MPHSSTAETNMDRNYQDLANIVYRAINQVDRALGSGFDAETYRNTLKIELISQEVQITSDFITNIVYKENIVGNKSVDLVITKAGLQLAINIYSQSEITTNLLLEMQAFLRFSDCQAGMIINFWYKPSTELVIV